MKRLTQRALFVCALAILTASASAQTNDALYGSWTANPDLLGPKGAGSGGAAVASTDTTSNMALNPAVLTTLTRSEFFASASEQPAHSALRSDALQSRSGPSMVGGASLLNPSLAIGGFLLRPRSVESNFAATPLPDGERLSGSLRSVVTDVGAAVAWHPTKRLHLGAEVVATHLELQGTASRFTAGNVETLRVATAAGDTRVTTTFGAMLEMTPTWTFGVSVARGSTWSADRNAFSPANNDQVIDAGSRYQVRRPNRVAGGVAWQATPRLQLSVEVDYVAYGEIQSTLSLPDQVIPGSYEIKDAVEPRLGAELSLPVGNGAAVQLRGGVHFSGADAIRYVGSDPTGVALFPGAARATQGSLGASVVLKTATLDLSYSAGSHEDAARLTAGLSLRF